MSMLPSNILTLTAHHKKFSCQLVRVKKQLIFLNNCLKLHYIPYGIRIKQCYNFPGANALYQNFNIRLLECIIESTNEKFQSVLRKFNETTLQLKEAGHLVCKSYKSSRHIYKIITARHQRKLSKLYPKHVTESQYIFRSYVDLPEHNEIQNNLHSRKFICNIRKKILLQRVRILESMNFLNTCIQQQLVPKSIRIKRCHKFLNSDILYDEFDQKLCQTILQAKKRLSDDINDFLIKIDQALDQDLRFPWCNDECREVRNLINKLQQTHKKKLIKLKRSYEMNMIRLNAVSKGDYSSSPSQPPPPSSSSSQSPPPSSSSSQLPPAPSSPSQPPPAPSSSSQPPLVYNFSQHELTANEIKLLIYGYRFILNQSPNCLQTECAVQEFIRTVRLAFMHEYSKSCTPRYYVRSQYIPSSLVDRSIDNERIENFLSELQNKSSKLENSQRHKFDTQHELREALKHLRQDKTILIQSADKGHSYVILDKKYYSTKIVSMLSKSDYYLHYKSRYHCQDTVEKVMDLFKYIQVPKIKKFIRNYGTQTPMFYALPKIHKSKTISQRLTNSSLQLRVFQMDRAPEDLPFRPIVASTRGPTQQLARLVDGLLRPFLLKIPSYIESYQDFLTKISAHRQIKPGTLLCTFDIKDLYTNIDHDLATEAITYWMKTYPRLTRKAVKKFLEDADEKLDISRLDINDLVNIVANAVYLVLDNNIFLFDGEYYKQVKGLAMGSSFAPTIANLTIGFLEVQLYKKVKNVLGNKIGSYVHKHWYRYIDDCQLLWPFNINRLNKFTKILQTLDPSIVFVREIHRKKLPFLNIMLEIKKNRLELDMYYKPTHTFAYLHFHSAHPPHIKRRIPYILAIMVRTIVSNKKVCKNRLLEMKEHLQARGYPTSLIEDAIKSSRSQKNSVGIKSKLYARRALNFRVVFNPSNDDLYSFIYKNLPVALGKARTDKFVGRKVNILPCNIKRLLTSSRFYYNSSPPRKCPSPCRRQNCQMCNHILSESSCKKILCNAPIDCTSRFVVYQLKCLDCKQSSFGHTDYLVKVQNCPQCSSRNFKIYPFHKMNTDRVIPRQLWMNNFLKKTKVNVS